MDPKRSSDEPEMMEVRTKGNGPISAPDAPVSTVPPARTASLEGRVAPRGPKEQHRVLPQEPRADVPKRQATSDIPPSHRKEALPPGLSAAELAGKEKPKRPSSADGGAKLPKPPSSETSSSAGILAADDFLIIEKPLPAHVKAEPGGAAQQQSSSIIAKLIGKTRSDPRSWPPEAISEIQRREEIFHQMKAYIEKLEERIQSQDQEISALNTALADTEHKLDTTRQDLNASRAFVSSEGTADAQNLIKGLRELNSAIDDFAFRFMQEVLPDAATSKEVTKDGLEGLGKTFHGAAKISSFINIAYQRKVTVGDFIHPFICYALTVRLIELVFDPFVPGMNKEESDIFKEIYAMVHRNEPQERSARWRAITYAHSQPHRKNDLFCEKAADDFLHRMIKAIEPLIGPDHPITFEHAKKEVGDAVKAVFMEAVKLQDKARTGYMSFDYMPFIPAVDQPFHPAYMETNQDVRQGGRGKGSMAVLNLGLGMQAWKSVVKEDKTVGKDVNIALKAMVLCGNWDPSA